MSWPIRPNTCSPLVYMIPVTCVWNPCKVTGPPKYSNQVYTHRFQLQEYTQLWKDELKHAYCLHETCTIWLLYHITVRCSAYIYIIICCMLTKIILSHMSPIILIWPVHFLVLVLPILLLQKNLIAIANLYQKFFTIEISQ